MMFERVAAPLDERDPSTPARILTYAIAVAERYGIGKRALSNFDRFHYAYAKAAGCSLLTFDKLLRKTDIDHAPDFLKPNLTPHNART